MTALDRALVFTLHRRPWYTRQVLNRWAQVRGLDRYWIGFSIDPSEGESQQRRVVRDFTAATGLTTHVRTNETRLGVLVNPLSSLRWAFEESNADFAVLGEEDVEVGNDFLEYVEWALASELVDIACGWSGELDGPEDGVLLRKWFNPWGWATTRRAFTEILDPTWDTDYSSGNPGGWDCNIGLRLVHSHPLTVSFPRASRTRHIGRWQGSHTTADTWGAADDPPSFRAEREPVEFMWRDDG